MLGWKKKNGENVKPIHLNKVTTWCWDNFDVIMHNFWHLKHIIKSSSIKSKLLVNISARWVNQLRIHFTSPNSTYIFFKSTFNCLSFNTISIPILTLKKCPQFLSGIWLGYFRHKQNLCFRSFYRKKGKKVAPIVRADSSHGKPFRF